MAKNTESTEGTAPTGGEETKPPAPERQGIFVRVNPRRRKNEFFRAGIAFSNEWKEVHVDRATESALRAEQMLEVADTLEAAQQQGSEDGNP